MVGDMSGVLSHPSIPQPVKIISQAQMCNNEMSKEKRRTKKWNEKKSIY